MALTRVQARRIQILARFMERHVPRKLFNMDTFKDPTRYPRCGTVACAMGWAVHVPTLKKHGLTDSGGPDFCPRLNGDAVSADEVAERFFGSPYYALFAGYLCDVIKTPKQWARHAREWLAGQEVQS